MIDFPANPTNGMVYGSYIYDSSITAWRNVNTDTGIGTLNAMGLKNVVPTSVVVGSGSATTNANGTVTFSGASSISLNGIFSSTYTDYKIVIGLQNAAGNSDVWMKWRVSGTDVSTGYYGASLNVAYTSSSPSVYGALSNANAASIGNFGIITGGSEMIASPRNTYSSIKNQGYSPSLAYFVSGGYNATTATRPDGFTIYPSASTISGTITVYGLTN